MSLVALAAIASAPMITSRRLGLRRFTNVAYKTDGDPEFKELGDAVKHIEKKMVEFKEATTEDAGKKAVAEVKSLMEAQEKKADEERQKFVKELEEKGASLKQITDEVKELKMKSGRKITGDMQVKTLKGIIAESIEEHKEKIMASEKKSLMEPIEMETKTVANIATANLTGDNYQQYLDWRPGMEPTGQTRFRDIFPTFQSAVDNVQYPRANTPVGEGSFGRQTEAATKAQIDRDYTMITLNLKPMAGYSVVSRQALRNIPFLQSWLPQSLLESLQDSEDTDFANALVAAATGSSTTAGVTIAQDRLVHFLKNLRKAKHVGNAIMIDPDIWATILTYRSANIKDFMEVITVDANGNVRILGRPVYDVNWLTGGRVLVGDTRKAGIVQSEGLTLRQSDSHASIFTSNEIAFLLERTEGLAIFRPDAFITAILT